MLNFMQASFLDPV